MELSIGFINDVHGYLEPHPELFYGKDGEYIKAAGGYAKIASIFEQIKNESENTLFFDGGDTFHGTLPVVSSKGEILLPILNKLGLSAMVGHWDFAYTPQHLLALDKHLNYPVLAINVFKENGTLFLEPYTMIEVGGQKVAVIGICANIIDKTMGKPFTEGIYVTDGLKEIDRYVREVKDLGASLVILLSHNGYPQDLELLKQTNGIDVCLSAHTHNRIYEPVKVNDTIVIQCGCHGSFVGHLKLTIEGGKIAHQYKLIEVTEDIDSNPEMEQLVNGAMASYRTLQKQIVGTTDKILHRYSTFSSSMDDLLLAAISKAAGVEIAFSNGWRYGSPIDKGNISIMDLYNMVPMNPVISMADMTGQEIIDMLEENFERTFSANPMQQMGGYCKRHIGLEVKYHIENPCGHRIEEIYHKGVRLDKKKMYKTAYITQQGVPDKYGSNKSDLETTTVQALINYLSDTNNGAKAFSKEE
ncbi:MULTISPECIES: bifunctional metallophosphatase/5'-nucleotidase [Bacteroidota]|uniref:bifunctional metallophosphatase/5'-nucleotidase n=1 Tax=Bacteroidota TaxID=976 RepID=UPI001CC04A97|nr:MULTISPECIES: 5'-nucleotidase C-terminal domain-containing protein [Bacteroidota]MBZ4190756.1 5'-nucleotidase C-terminal domain-containing protein [Niabella beijingensis]UMQ40852.1 5'-nucleotidase C-terminal domain-containing protein [Chryseobacterium sp. Y16C]